MNSLKKKWKLVSHTSSRVLYRIHITYVNILAISSICHILLRPLGYALLFLSPSFKGLVPAADKHNSY
jgi:hypothetical protein